MRIGSIIFLLALGLSTLTACGGASSESDAEEPPSVGTTEDGAQVTEGDVEVEVEQVGEE